MLFFLLSSGLLLVGVILLACFFIRLSRDMKQDRPLDRYVYRFGLATGLVFVALILQRLVGFAFVFLGFMLVVFLCILWANRFITPAKARGQNPSKGADQGLVQMSGYTKIISDNEVVKRILRLQGFVDAIRSIAGYNEESMEEQTADIRKMESVYLPNIDMLIQQYIKISSHDKQYRPVKLLSDLDTMTEGIRQIYFYILNKNKITIDADSSALISAMEIDGLTDKEYPFIVKSNQR